MARYEIRVLPSVRKDLRRMDKNDVRRILSRIESLAVDPRPNDCRKLTGRELYRVRAGVYRILYEIRDEEVVVVVVKVGHRRR
jgi:mRNA interferase RelE/StbE